MIGFTESISLPVCFGGAIDVFWNGAGTVHVETGPEELTLYANDPALESLAKQMLYFACNNSLGGFHAEAEPGAFGHGDAHWPIFPSTIFRMAATTPSMSSSEVSTFTASFACFNGAMAR